MIITLARHAEVDKRYLGAYNGHNDISLSKEGYIQAETLAKKFENRNFDAYYCSDLLRARESFKPFKKDAIYTPKLREKSWGRHEGMSFDEIVKSENVNYENFEQWLSVLDGEDYREFIHRVETLFMHELNNTADNNIFVMTHAGVIKALFHIIKKIPLQDAFSQKIGYAQYTVLDTTKALFLKENI